MPHQISDDNFALLLEIKEEWNKAEKDIKIAEQVTNNIVIPSVKELRYAGRRLIDAIHEMATQNNEKVVSGLLEECRFDCYRSRHDAVDAATAKISVDLDIMSRRLGYKAILAVFPDFPALCRSLDSIREKISASRKNRNNREAIYSSIESVDFPDLVRIFSEMKSSENMMKGMVQQERRKEFYHKAAFWIGIIAFIASVAWEGWKYIFQQH